MPTATPKYDTDGSWKFRQYDSQSWDKLKLTLQTALRPFYPDKNAETDPIFGHPADGWANSLLSEAYDAVSTMRWHGLRLSNEQLRAEQKDVLSRLRKAAKCLDTMSHDLNIMLGIDADLLGCRDKILEIIPLVAAADTVISGLPTAKKRRDAEDHAAVEMAIRTLRILKAEGISTSATAETNSGYISKAIQILKIIGDALGLVLDPKTWVKKVAKAKQSASDLG